MLQGVVTEVCGARTVMGGVLQVLLDGEAGEIAFTNREMSVPAPYTILHIRVSRSTCTGLLRPDLNSPNPEWSGSGSAGTVGAPYLCRAEGQVWFEVEVIEASGIACVGIAGANFRCDRFGIMGKSVSWGIAPDGTVISWCAQPPHTPSLCHRGPYLSHYYK
jgi:hypothetical protein